MAGVDRVTHVVAAVIERDGRYLLCRRPPHKRHAGQWEFPGGKLEPGEDHLAAVRRELEEELGLQVTAVGDLYLSVSEPDSHFVIDFVAVHVRGTPLCREHSALAWVAPQQLLQYELAAADRLFAQGLLASGA